MVKNLPAMQENRAQSLGRDDPLEKGITTHSSLLAWRNPMDRGAWRATVHGVAKSRTRLKQVSMQARTFTSFTATSMSQWFPSLINGLTGVRTGTVWVTEEKCTARSW